MKQIFWTYRPERINSPYNLWEVTLNGTYTASFFLENQFGDWSSAWLTKILDSEINESNYTWEIVPWIKKLTRFIIAEYNELYVDPVELARSITNVWARFNIDMFTLNSDAITWIKTNTNLVETSPNIFELSPESIDPFTKEIIPARYLNLN